MWFCIHLIEEKRKNRTPYHDILPTDFSAWPSTWTDQELEPLKGHLSEGAKNYRRVIRAQYDAICAVYPAYSESVTFEEY